MAIKEYLVIDSTINQPPTGDHPTDKALANALPHAKQSKQHPAQSGHENNANLRFLGTATTILEWEGIRILTDPNFLHAGDHVHLGPGVKGTRLTNPSVDLHDLPRVDLICLSHYHADHFDQEVEASLRRDLPIITTPHAKDHLADQKSAGERFSAVHALDFFESALVDIRPGSKGLSMSQAGQQTTSKRAAIKVTGMPGKHVPPGVLGTANDLLKAVPPTNGWMIELGFTEGESEADFASGYRIYISGDTLMVDELKEIPERYKGQQIDLMLVHLGGTTIPSPSMPLLMVTMDAEQGLQLVRLINPDMTIPIHYDDYDVFLSPLSEFRKAMTEAGLNDKLITLDRGEEYKFRARRDP